MKWLHTNRAQVAYGALLAAASLLFAACDDDDPAPPAPPNNESDAGDVGGDTTGPEPPYVPYEPDGEIAWAFRGDGHYLSPLSRGDDGTLFVGTASGELVAIAPETGEPRWRYATGGRIGAAPTVLAGGQVAVGAWDGRLYVVNPDGTLAWDYQTDALIDQSVSVDGAGRLYVASNDGMLHVLSATGELERSLELGAAPTTAVSILDDGQEQTLFVATLDHKVHCIDGAGEARVADVGGHGRYDIALSSQGVGYLGTHNGRIVAVERDCTVRWDVSHTWAVIMPPALDPSGALYAGGHNRQIFRFDAASGERVWQSPTRRYQAFSGAPSLGADGKLYGSADSLLVATASGTVTALSPLDVIGPPVLGRAEAGEEGAVFATTEQGYLLRLEVGAAAPGESDWPTQHGNYARTGYLRVR